MVLIWLQHGCREHNERLTRGVWRKERREWYNYTLIKTFKNLSNKYNKEWHEYTYGIFILVKICNNLLPGISHTITSIN